MCPGGSGVRSTRVNHCQPLPQVVVIHVVVAIIVVAVAVVVVDRKFFVLGWPFTLFFTEEKVVAIYKRDLCMHKIYVLFQARKIHYGSAI